jgi:predicted regulator of Ras-like GTPase activity (Roadblock/LC7/MglB family)
MGVERIGKGLDIDRCNRMTFEYGKAMIICEPAGDALVAVVAQDAKALGIIRHKMKSYLPELEKHF